MSIVALYFYLRCIHRTNDFAVRDVDVSEVMHIPKCMPTPVNIEEEPLKAEILKQSIAAGNAIPEPDFIEKRI